MEKTGYATLIVRSLVHMPDMNSVSYVEANATLTGTFRFEQTFVVITS